LEKIAVLFQRGLCHRKSRLDDYGVLLCELSEGFFLLSIVMVAVVGCSALRGPITSEELGSMKKVAVFSYLSDSMYHINVGTLVFANREHQIHVPQWQIRAHSEEQVREQLLQNPRWTDVEILEDSVFPRRIGDDVEDIDRILKKAVAAGFDTAVIVLPTFAVGKDMMQPGYGIYNRSFMGSEKSCAYGDFLVRVYDARREKYLDGDFARRSKQLFAETPASCSEEAVVWKDNPQDYSEAEMADLQAVLKRQVAFGIGEALRRMKLLN